MTDTPIIRYAGFDPTERDHRDYFGITTETAEALFCAGLDTAEIAARFHNVSEATIYNLLARAREKRWKS